LSLHTDLIDRLGGGEGGLDFDEIHRHQPAGRFLVVLEEPLELTGLVDGQRREDLALLVRLELADEVDRIVVGEIVKQFRALFGSEGGQQVTALLALLHLGKSVRGQLRG